MALSRGSLVVILQATKSRTSANPSLASTHRATIDAPVVESLVIPLAVVVIDELLERAANVTLAARHHMMRFSSIRSAIACRSRRPNQRERPARIIWRADASITAGVYNTTRKSSCSGVPAELWDSTGRIS